MSNQKPKEKKSCTFCRKDGHELFGTPSCKERRGCGKCRELKDHYALDCPDHDVWPDYDRQVCDHCCEDHEYEKCKNRGAGDVPCSHCGHDHPSRKCPFRRNGKFPGDLGEDMVRQFTRQARDKYLQKQAKKITPTAKGSTLPTLLSQRQGSIGSPQKPSQGIQTGSQATIGGSGALKLAEDDDPVTAQRKKWAEAEKHLPKRQAVPSQNAQTETIKSNFFEIKINPSATLLKYSITLGDVGKSYAESQLDSNDKSDVKGKGKEEDSAKKKDKDKRKMRRETKRFLIDSLLTANPPSHKAWATDYDSIIISGSPLYVDSEKFLGQVTETPHHCTGPGKNPGQVLVNSFVTYLGEVDLEGLKKHIEKKADFEELADVLKSLNIISWKGINDNSFQGGRIGNRFYPQSLIGKDDFQEKTPLYRFRDGFFSSTRAGDGLVLLNVNTVTSAFFSPMKLQRWIELRWKNHRPSNKEFRSKFKDVRVTFDFHKNSRLWVISGISDDIVSKTTFKDKEKKEHKVSAYLKKTYDGKEYRWTDTDWSGYCINVGSQSRPIWYPATKLSIVDWQIVKEKLQSDYADRMISKGEKRPQKSKDSIRGIMDLLGLKSESTFYKSFGITPELKLVEVKPVTVNPPKLVFSVRDDYIPPALSDGSWNLSGQSSFIQHGNTCTKVHIINLTTETDGLKGGLENLLNQMARYSLSAAGVVYRMSDPSPPNLPTPAKPEDINDFNKTYREKCQSTLEEALSSLGTDRKSIPFILIVLPKKDIPLYSEIKRWGDCEVGIPTVCITSAKWKKAGDVTLCANICLKINSKLKGVSHKIEGSGVPTTFGNPAKSSRARKSTMIVGADVTHPKEGHEEKCPSIAGVVATDQDESSCYLASARLQKGKQEYISDLAGMMKERIIAWYSKTKNTTNPLKTANWKDRLPKHILFYRDGVSESQYGMVLSEEKEQVLIGCQQAFEEVKKDAKLNQYKNREKWAPRLTLLVVVKRHHTRFFPRQEIPLVTDSDRKCDINVPAGKVIDTKVVGPLHRSFYLQSHHSALGTARSAHYVVINDDNNYSLLELQQITNNLCYTSARATKAVSVCIPAGYADLLCNRLRCYMKPALDGYLNDDKDEKSKDKRKKSTSPRSTVSIPSSAKKPEDLSYIKEHEDDPRVWKVAGREDDTRKSPWDPKLDGCMFYV